MIENKFLELLDKRGQRERRRIPLSDVQRATGISWTTLQSWAQGEVRRFDAETIEKLLVFFGVDDLGALLVYIPSPSLPELDQNPLGVETAQPSLTPGA